MADLFSIEKGKVGIKAAVPGKYPLVTTGENFLSNEEAHFSGDAVVIPMISATGHGHASIKRLHHVQGEFAVGSILCACIAKDEKRVSARYAYLYLSATKDTLLVPLMQGSANVSLKLADIAGIEIPLPPLPEQRAIVAKLDELRDKTTQINARLDAIEADADALVLSMHNELSGSRTVALSDVIELYEESVAIESDMSYPQVGVRSFGAGLFAKPAITGAETTYRSFNRLYKDAFVLSQVKGWEGAIALTPPELVGMHASPEYRTFRCLPRRASPQYLVEIFKRPWFWSLLQDATRGVGARRERTRPEQFLNVVLPMPEYDKQLEGAQIFKNLTALRTSHAAIRQSNTALVPATLERVFGEHRAPAAESSGTATDLRLHSDVCVTSAARETI